jgi:hypothetical protein
MDVRSKLRKLKRSTIRADSLSEWSDFDREMALEGLDFLLDELSEIREEIIGGIVYDGSTEESAEGIVN